MPKYTKTCSCCEVEKPVADFYKQSANKDGLMYRCKVCDKEKRQALHATEPELYAERRRAAQRKYKYGLTEACFTKLWDRFGGKCGCCGVSLDDTMTIYHGRNKVVIDHCHKTGDVRGLLCTMCNKGIGLLGDNETGLENALQYLRRYTNG